MSDISVHNSNSSQTSQIIYRPSEIIGIFNSILARQSVNAQVVFLRGVYIANPHSGHWAYCYDTLKDEDSQEELTLRLTIQQQENLKSGNIVNVGGIISRNITAKGYIQIILNVTRIEIIKEQLVDETESKRMEVRQKKSTAGFKNVDAIIENLLYTDCRPKIALILAKSSITMSDFDAGINVSKMAIDFEEYRVNFSNTTEFINKLKTIDNLNYDAIAIIRGGGEGIEKLDDLNILNAIVELKTPIISAIGHVEEKLFIKQIVDKVAPTPNGLGQYFSEIVESVNEKKTHSKAILTEQIRKQFKEQIEAERKQNKELQDKLRILTENQKIATEAQQLATKKHNEQVETANKQNKELQEKLRVLTENQKKTSDAQQLAVKRFNEQIEAANKQNKILQEQLKELNENQRKSQEQHKQQQEQLRKDLTKMQEDNSKLQTSLEKVSAQNTESLKELNQAKEKAKDLEHMLAEARTKSSGNTGMWIVLFAIIAVMLMLLF